MKGLQRFMVGRSGSDQLSVFLIIASLVLSWTGRITGVTIVVTAGYVLLGLAIFRILSRNVAKRRSENYLLLKWVEPWKKRLNLTGRQIKEYKTHRYYECSGCGKKLRIPRKKGGGKIKITCPACRSQIIRKIY
ncbi:MAG: hypothetical protein D5S00_06795 [Tindallia sp. MSAO_Bac2]|nr:MAG: hypothetical protein D5S00_06795 [Tindallia sp. MSAO_Bac2]